MLEDLVYYWAEKFPPSFNAKAPTLLSISYYPLKIIAAEWTTHVELMRLSIKQYEYAMDDHSNLPIQLEKLNSDLRNLQGWRHRGMSTQEKIGSVIRFIKSCGLKEPQAELPESLVEDYEHLATCVRECTQRLETMLPVITSLVQIVDSRRSFAETANISRLTHLALVFVPLSFITSLFSTGQDMAPGGSSFWVYLVVAIPMTILVFLVARAPIIGRCLLSSIRESQRIVPIIPFRESLQVYNLQPPEYN